MIVVENVLNEAFSYLPAMRFNEEDVDSPSFKPIFGYGDENELMAFLKLQEGNKRPYPLIWLVYPYTEYHSKNRVDLKSVKLIVAVDNKIKSQLNKDRLELNYKRIINPLCDNIINVLKRGNIFNTDPEFIITKFPKYSHSNSNFTTDIWDASQIVFSTSIIGTCLKPIKI